MRLPAVVAVLVVASAACRMDPRSPEGFHLPAGDPERGRTAFLELKCNTCHKVAGADLPEPTVQPPVPVVLGGEVPHARTDGDLVTSIIDPSHRLAPGYRPEFIRKGDRSRMPEYAQVMTVQQMIDLVAFLQSRYTVVRPGR
jgi:mono/diheme cytochrome c family protein